MLSAQTITGFNNSIQATFKTGDLEIKQGEIASNVVVISNSGNVPQKVSIELSYPYGWKSMSIIGKEYTIPPLDTFYIPCTVIPAGLINGNTKFLITAVIFNEDGVQLSKAKYNVSTKKFVQWELSTLPSKKTYLKNDETDKDFKLNIFNSGNYDQEIVVSVDGLRDDVVLKDTNNMIVKKNLFSINLTPWSDTTFVYNAQYLRGKRNYRKVPIDSYRPNANLNEYRYSVLTKTSEPKTSNSKSRYTKYSKISFIKLANEKRLQTSGGNNIPLTFNMNINGLFQNFTNTSIFLRGYKQLDTDRSLTYSSNFFFTQHELNDKTFDDIQFNVGYYFPKGNVNIGNINGNVIGLVNAGKGIKGKYAITNNQTVGAFVIRNPRLFDAISTSYGATHEFILSKRSAIRSFAARSDNHLTNTATNVVGTRANYTFKKKHSVTLGVVGSIKDELVAPNTTESATGYNISAGYRSTFFKKKWLTGFNGSYTSPRFGGGNVESINFNLNNNVKLKNDWSLTLVNYFRDQKATPNQINRNDYSITILNNQLNVFNHKILKKVVPGVYYNINNQLFSNLHKRGLNVRYGDFKLKNNFRYSINLAAGYNRDYAFEGLNDYFSFQSNFTLSFRNVSLFSFYNYGPNSVRDQELLALNGIKPHFMRASLQHQYMFKDDHFILESAVSYNYRSTYKQHNIGYYPTFNFITNNGWRFRFTAGYSYNKSDYSELLRATTSEFTGRGSTASSNWNFNFGLTKDFNIPIPWMEQTHQNIDFKVFLDINGNGIYEESEYPLENIVLTVDQEEIITDKDGVAKLENVERGQHLFYSFAIENLDGWFPKSNDSLTIEEAGTYYVPYVRGVKVKGQIIVNREKVTTITQKELDLSDIKISAISENPEGKDEVYETLSSTDGTFEIYLPFGNYSISMDETILNGTYSLLENNIEVQLNESLENIQLSFFIMQKRRKIKVKKF